MSDELLGGVAAGTAFGVSITVIVLFTLAYYVLCAVAYWKIFTKAGEKGWKSLIPFYSGYVQYRLTWKTSMFWLTLVAVVANGVLTKMQEQGLIWSILTLVVSLAVIVLCVMRANKLAKSFGHGAGYTVGLVLLQPIFILMLGFGSSQYIGNTTKM